MLADALPDADWRRRQADGRLGEALAWQGDYVDAELLLLDTAEWMQATSSVQGLDESEKQAITLRAMQRVERLYRIWHQAEPTAGYDGEAELWHEAYQQRRSSERQSD